jgi:transposase
MQALTTIGLDIAKSVFQVHGTDAEGQVIIRRQLRGRYVLALFQKLAPCLIGIEACAASHHWSRQHDAADAEAICEAVTRVNMPFVPTNTPDQQSCLTLHRTRLLFIRQQTAVINAIGEQRSCNHNFFDLGSR